MEMRAIMEMPGNPEGADLVLLRKILWANRVLPGLVFPEGPAVARRLGEMPVLQESSEVREVILVLMIIPPSS